MTELGEAVFWGSIHKYLSLLAFGILTICTIFSIIWLVKRKKPEEAEAYGKLVYLAAIIAGIFLFIQVFLVGHFFSISVMRLSPEITSYPVFRLKTRIATLSVILLAAYFLFSGRIARFEKFKRPVLSQLCIILSYACTLISFYYGIFIIEGLRAVKLTPIFSILHVYMTVLTGGGMIFAIVSEILYLIKKDKAYDLGAHFGGGLAFITSIIGVMVGFGIFAALVATGRPDRAAEIGSYFFGSWKYSNPSVWKVRTYIPLWTKTPLTLGYVILGLGYFLGWKYTKLEEDKWRNLHFSIGIIALILILVLCSITIPNIMMHHLEEL